MTSRNPVLSMRLLPVALLALATPALAQQSATLPTFPITEWETPWDPKDLIRDPIADDQGRIWFCGMLGNFIGLFEPGTGKFKRYELPAGTIPHNVIVDRQGRAWLSGNRNGTINRIDPASGETTGRMSLGPEGLGLPVAAGDTVWLIDAMRLRHVDPERMVVDRTVRLDRGSFMNAGFAAGPDALYVQRADARILALDPGSGTRTGTIRLQRPGALAAYAAGGLVLAAEDGVATVDPETGEQRWLRRLGVARVNAIATDITTLWVQGSPASGGRDRLWRLDALDGRVLGSIDLPGYGVAGMAAVGDEAWIVTPGGQLQVVGPS